MKLMVFIGYFAISTTTGLPLHGDRLEMYVHCSALWLKEKPALH